MINTKWNNKKQYKMICMNIHYNPIRKEYYLGYLYTAQCE